MRTRFYSMLFLSCLLSSNPVMSQKSETRITPFLPDMVMQFPGVRDITISPDEKEMYFTFQSYIGDLSAIAFCININGKWSNPEVAPFSGRFHDLEPSFAPDGLRIYFASDRPGTMEGGDSKNYDIWMVERKSLQSDWSQPANIGSPVNTKGNEFYPIVTKSGNLYFTGDGPLSKGKDDIFVSVFLNGKYASPVPVGDSVNSAEYEFNAFVDPNEKYMIFTCYNRQGGFGSGDLYISHNLDKGSLSWKWSAPASLGMGINSAQMDYCPYVDSKNGILYFTSKRTGLLTRFDMPGNKDFLLKEMNRYDNGLSRFYKTLFTPDAFK